MDPSKYSWGKNFRIFKKEVKISKNSNLRQNFVEQKNNKIKSNLFHELLTFIPNLEKSIPEKENYSTF